MEDYPSNSHKPKTKAAEKPEKKVEAVVSGTARTAKKSELAKFADSFITEDAANVKSYILQDVIIPAAKRIIDDVVVGSLRMLLFGERDRRDGRSNASKVSYRSYYDRENGRRDSNSPSRVRSGFDYDNITFETRGDAEAVLTEMENIIEQFDMVSVADLYDLAAVSNNNYSANRYGWTNLASARIDRARDGGYYIRLPRALPLN